MQLIRSAGTGCWISVHTKALQCMISELTKAWDRDLQRLDVIRLGLDEYMHRYMHSLLGRG
jgi:hypothetical protein